MKTRLRPEILEERLTPSASLVRDINTQPIPVGSNPSGLTEVNGRLFFRANIPTTGVELWSSDGTSSGTTLVRDIRPGVGDSNPFNHMNIGGVLFFAADDGTNGFELWRTDGTSTGTVLVRDIRTGSASSSPQNLANVGGLLYFTANDGTNGFELWRSDGTSSGTTLVRDIRPGSDSSNPNELTNFSGMLYFRANDGINGLELWRSDGTSSGTMLVADIDPVGSSFPEDITVVGSRLMFASGTSEVGTELFMFMNAPVSSVTGLTVNGGDPQRSRIVSIAVSLSAPVDATLFQNPGAVVLTRTSGGPAATVTIGSGLVVTPGAGGTSTLTLTFTTTSNPAIENGSLADGYWQLSIPSLWYTSPLNSPNLRRLFGDVDANGTVDNLDFANFGGVFGGSSIAIDFDNSGTVDALDFAQFGTRFGISL